MMDPMTIGQLAARCGLSVRTLRFYADAGQNPTAMYDAWEWYARALRAHA